MDFGVKSIKHINVKRNCVIVFQDYQKGAVKPYMISFWTDLGFTAFGTILHLSGYLRLLAWPEMNGMLGTSL